MSAAAETLPCSTCRAPVDPLRASRVAHFDERFCYFCSPGCEERYRTAEPERSQARPKAVAALQAPLPSFDDPSWEHVTPNQALDAAPELALAHANTSLAEGPAPPGFREPDADDAAASPHLGVEDPALSVDAGTLLLSLAVLGATLSLVLSLTGSSELSLAARLVVAAVATAALVAECAMGQRSATELHPLATLCGPVVAVAAAIGLRLSEQAEA